MKFRVWLAGMALAIGWVAAGPGWAVDFQIGAISIDAPWATGLAARSRDIQRLFYHQQRW